MILLRTLALVAVISWMGYAPCVAEPTPESTSTEPAGQADFDEAIRVRVNTSGLRDLNRVIDLLAAASDKGLDEETESFAAAMLSDALMERAKSLAQVINAQALLSTDERVRDRVLKIRQLVQSDLRRVLANDDAPAEASLLLGKVAALPGGDPHEARRMLGRYLESDEVAPAQQAVAYALRAQVQSTPENALADFNRAVELAPDNVALLLQRALYHQRNRSDYDSALQDADAVLAINPEEANAYIIKGENLRLLSRMDEAIEAFDRATELAPRSPRPFQNRGDIHRGRGEYEKAITQYSKVLELQPGVMATLVQRAEAYLRAGRLEEALADADLVVQKQPGLFTPLSIAAHRIRGEVLASTDRLEEAIGEIERVAVAVPDQLELKMQLALYYLFDRQTSKAIETYSEVIEADAQNFLALRSRGDAFLNLGKHQEAVDDFERALAVRPQDTALLNNYAWVLATSPDDDVRDGPRSIELATKACEITDYKKPHILSTLAASYAETGDFETAIKWSTQAVSLDDPDHGGQLSEELESYKLGKPWRERQSMQEEAQDPLPEADTLPSDVQLQPL